MATDLSPSQPPGPAPEAVPDPNVRAFWRAAAILTSLIVVAIVAFVIFYPDDGTHQDRASQVREAEAAPPRIITKPSEGRPPESPGDPGGWEQLALFGVIVAGLGTVSFFVWRSSKRARARPPRSSAGASP